MRVLLLIAFLFSSAGLLAQNFEDDFTDGDFTSDPEWTGDTDNFVIGDLEGNKVIRLSDAGGAANTSYLSTPSSAVTGYWEFWVQIDGSTPSGSNNIQVFVMSDSADLTGAVNGYAVRAGETEDDVFRLVRYDAGFEAAIVVSDTTVLQSGTSYRVRVDRDGSGNWSIQVGEGYNGELKDSENTGTDNTYSSATHFGFLVNYTSSRTDDFYFDFKIDPPPVIIDPLYVDSFLVFSETEIDLTFTRDIDFGSVSTSDFELNGSLNPDSFTDQEPNALRITFTDSFSGGENELAISGIEPITNDTVLTDTTITFFQYGDYETGDIIINEFLKDPPPGSDLPEYVELRNTSAEYLNLKNWVIGDNSSEVVISETDLVILPDSFLVLTGDTDALTTTFGPGEYVDVSLPALNNSGDQIRIFDENGIMVDSLEYTSAWGGVDVALERRTADAPSRLQPNWGDSPEEIGTPGRANAIEPDTTPPDLESLTFLNDSTMQLVFTEQIKAGPAEDPGNYEVALSVKVNPEAAENETVKATFFTPDTVVLEFRISLYSNAPLNLLIENQEDEFGNVASTIQREFHLVLTEEALPGEVSINEFMFDPADDYSEFVELYNHTSKTFDLNGWTFNDNSGNRKEITDEALYLRPGDYLVLAPDSTLSDLFPGISLIDVPGFPALNNNTDDLVLRDAEGVLIDSVTYTNSWGGNEITLERRTVDVSGIYIENWGDSPSQDLGTPGIQNAILPDTESPYVETARALDQQTIELYFSERITESEATDPANYNFTPSLVETSIILNTDTVRISLSQPLPDGEQVLIKILDQKDVFGNVRSVDSAEVIWFEFVAADRGDVVINEILYRRADADSPEFVELYNNTNFNFDLSGWTIIDAGSNEAVLPEGVFLAGGEYLVLTDNEEFAGAIDGGVYLSNFPSLNDSGDEIVIRNTEGATIDSLYYQDLWGGDEPGRSLERKDPGGASNDASNWATSTSSNGFSAGVMSSVFEEDNKPPELVFTTRQDSLVRVIFSEFVSITQETEFYVNGGSSEVMRFDADQGNVLYLSWNQPVVSEPAKSKKQNSMVEITGIEDVKGNTSASLASPIAIRASAGSVVINEIMYDPLADDEDNLPDQTEYIELFNTGTEAVSLEGVSLHDAPDEDGEVRAITPVSSQYKWIPAGEYFLIYAEDATDLFSESRVVEYFSLEGVSDQFTMRVYRSSLSLASSGDAVYLADSTGATVDSVFYDESWQNPNVFDTDGIALERIDPDGPSDDESNWSSSTDVSGGTPYGENTIYQEAGTGPENVGISFSPNPFSPDDDGFNDNLFINYRLEAPDYLLRIRIFDRYGRQVRELADGVQAGFEGALIWDGLTDDRRKNRVGIYIILFEAYNSATGKDRTFKETVVLARMF